MTRPIVQYLMEGYPPYVGGAEVQAHRMAQLLLPEFDMRVLTKVQPNTVRREVMDGVRVRRVPMEEGGGFLYAILGAARFTVAGSFSQRPALVQGFQLNHATLAAAALAARYTAPLVIKVTNRVEFERATDRRHRAQNALLLRAAQAVVVPSRTLLQMARENGVAESRIHYIPNGVDTSRFRPPTAHERGEARAALGLDGEFVFLWVGRLHPLKRLDLLHDAWRRVMTSRPDARLLIVGKGEEEAAAAAFQAEFPGAVLRPPVRPDPVPYYRAADAFVLTSASEGLSNALLESLACGLPSVVADAPENLEVGDDLLRPFERGCAGSAARVMLETMEMDRPGRAGAEAYAMETTATRWRDLYRSLIA